MHFRNGRISKDSEAAMTTAILVLIACFSILAAVVWSAKRFIDRMWF